MTIVHGLISPTTWQRTGNISFLLVTIPPWVNTNNVLFPGKSLSGEIPAPCFQSHLSPSPRNPDPRGSGSRSSLSRYSRGVNIRRDVYISPISLTVWLNSFGHGYHTMPVWGKKPKERMITPLIFSVTEDERRTQPSPLYTCTLLIILRQQQKTGNLWFM